MTRHHNVERERAPSTFSLISFDFVLDISVSNHFWERRTKRTEIKNEHNEKLWQISVVFVLFHIFFFSFWAKWDCGIELQLHIVSTHFRSYFCKMLPCMCNWRCILVSIVLCDSNSDVTFFKSTAVADFTSFNFISIFYRIGQAFHDSFFFCIKHLLAVFVSSVSSAALVVSLFQMKFTANWRLRIFDHLFDHSMDRLRSRRRSFYACVFISNELVWFSSLLCSSSSSLSFCFVLFCKNWNEQNVRTRKAIVGWKSMVYRLKVQFDCKSKRT